MATSVRSVERAFDILKCFQFAENDSVSLGSIAESVDLPVSTIFRLLGTLVSIGVLQRNEDHSYSTGEELYLLGAVIASQFRPRSAALPYMRTLRDETKEAVSLYGMQDGFRVCYEHLLGTLSNRCIVRVGEHLPLWAGAAGKVLLAYAGEGAIEREASKLMKLTPATITDREELIEELHRIRMQDYAVSRGERDEGIVSIAVPIFDRDGRSPLCISLSAPSARVDLEKIGEFAAKMQAISAKISEELAEYEF